MARAAAVASIMGDMGEKPDRRIVLECRKNGDGRWRWYNRETGEDTEVSGATLADAKLACCEAWGNGGLPWELQARWMQ